MIPVQYRQPMSHPRPATPSDPVPTAIGGLIAMAVGIGIGRFVYTPILPSMIAETGLSKSVSGLIASANFAGYLLGALLATRSSLPGPARTWLPGALVLSAATTTAMGLTTSVAAFIALRLAGGIASALALILSSAIVLGRMTEARRPGLVSLHFAGVGVGIAVSAAVVSALLATGAGAGAMWIAVGAVSAAGAAAVAWLMPPPAPPAAAAPPADGAQSGALRRMVVAYGLFGFGYVITATFLVAIVRETAAIRALEPVIWILVGLGAAPSIALWSALGRRIGTARAFAVAALVEAAAVLASVVWSSPVGICLSAILFGGTFMGLTALGLQRARELATGDPRRAMAAMTSAFGIGQIVGPLMAGLASDLLGGFVVALLGAAGALVLAALLVRR